MVDEIWEAVVGYEGIFVISGSGQVRRILTYHARHAGKILTPQIRKGYYAIRLNHKGKATWYSVHRLVAAAFIGAAPTKKHQINHKDGNKLNNHFLNLEWVTPLENHEHAVRLGLKNTIAVKGVKWSGAGAKLTKNQVKQIRQAASTITNRKLARIFNVTDANICCVRRRRSWKDLE